MNRAAYVVLGVTLDGNKDILSITIGANESSKFWLGMLNDLKNRGVKEVLFFCVDGLIGFKYVSYKDIKKIASDFKAVYKAPNEEIALAELEGVKEIWGKKYPYALSSWEQNWDVVRPFFQFSEDIRRIMYTIRQILLKE